MFRLSRACRLDTMKLFLLLSFVACAYASTAKWTQMAVTFGPTEEGHDQLFLWKVQNTLAEAEKGRWQKVSIQNDLNVQFVGVEPNDHAFNPFYSNGLLAGAQFCQPVQLIKATGPPLNPLAGGTNVVLKIGGIDHYCSRFLIVSPETVKAGRKSMTPFATGLWVLDVNSKTGYKELPTDINKLLAETPYKKQGCFENMGTHYNYNLTKSFDCSSIYSWTIMGVDNDVNAIAWQILGHRTTFHYPWYDFVTKKAVQLLAPNAPECLYDLVDKYTLTSTHLFFTDKTWDIVCPKN